MKILTEKEQLRAKLDEIDTSIKFTINKLDKALKRRDRKETWGFYSFILEEYWFLDYTYKSTSTQLNLLKEYRDVISDMIIECD